MVLANPQTLPASTFGGPIVQLGKFVTTQGKSEHVGIDGLVGDAFRVKKSSDHNSLYGIGYYFQGCNLAIAGLAFGVNAFYLAPTKVKGVVLQENRFSNLGFEYSRTNYPIYLAARGMLCCPLPWDIVVDVGVGPNIVRASNFKEKSLDSGITIPDGPIFSRKSITLFSATAGVGLRMNALLTNLSFEINYRFFYLGQGRFNKASGQLKNTLHTGNHYAHALLFSLSM